MVRDGSDLGQFSPTALATFRPASHPATLTHNNKELKMSFTNTPYRSNPPPFAVLECGPFSVTFNKERHHAKS